MKELALVDADIVAFRCASSAENDPQDIAEVRVDELMRRILHETGALEYKCYLTGKDNFRKTIYPEYKANRRDKVRPRHLSACRDHLVKYWNAQIINGREADDELGIEQTAHELDSIICSIDKDLLQIPGYHYNFVRGEQCFISPFDGLRNFYNQVITGDGSDNIPAYDGKFRSATPKFIAKLTSPLWEMTDELDMWNYVHDVWYDNTPEDLSTHSQMERLYRNAKCLWIWRKEFDVWIPPDERV